MSISLEAIERIAHLARLPLEHTSDGHPIQDDLNRMVKMVDQIRGADTQGISPMAHPLNMSQAFRTDDITELNEREQLISLSSKAEAGLYLVPPVIE